VSEPALVSVVVPTYNNARYIEQALQSVFHQKYPHCEVIVVDDGSTDDTQTVLRPYASRLRKICQQNAGSAAARNTGLKQASGKYVVLLDADDWLLPDKLHKQVDLLEANPALGAVHSGWRLVTADGSHIKDITPWHDAPKLDLATWLKWKPVKMGAMLFRRDWLEKVGYLDPELQQSHDVDLMLRLALAGCEMIWLKEPTLCYRHHRESTIRKGAVDQAYYALKTMDKFFAQPGLPSHIRHREQITRYFSTMWVSWHLFRTGFAGEAVPYLEKTRNLSPIDIERLVMDWVRHYVRWSYVDGRDPTETRQMWPYFQQAARLDDITWLPLQQRLDWWLDMWWHYLQGNWEQAAQQLGQYRDFSPAEFVSMVQFYLLVSPALVTITTVQQFWQDATRQGLIPKAEQYRAATLYLTLFGQTVLSGRLSIALPALLKAMQYSYHPAAWPAWGRFLQAGLAYISSQFWQTGKVLVNQS
jgi:glycosyltransferase involved in cell wall biosynthesis